MDARLSRLRTWGGALGVVKQRPVDLAFWRCYSLPQALQGSSVLLTFHDLFLSHGFNSLSDWVATCIYRTADGLGEDTSCCLWHACILHDIVLHVFPTGAMREAYLMVLFDTVRSWGYG